MESSLVAGVNCRDLGQIVRISVIFATNAQLARRPINPGIELAEPCFWHIGTWLHVPSLHNEDSDPWRERPEDALGMPDVRARYLERD